MSRPVAGLALLLLGCPKAPSPAPTEPVQPPGPKTPAGYQTIGLPGQFKQVRPLTSDALPDGSIAISGAAVRVVQYQWSVKIPATGDPIQNTFDPGRIEFVSDNGTGGLNAVGVLGGVPEDKAWYGDIDAFGNLSTRQTYLSEGAGQLRAVVRVDSEVAFAGEVLDDTGNLRGWVLLADNQGRDLWKTELGDSTAQGLTWLSTTGQNLIAAGWTLGETEDPWVAVVDLEGTVVAEHSWPDPAWTRLTSGRLLTDNDLLLAGISAPTESGILDGTGSLWVGRVGPDGTARWDRQERNDLSLITRATPWGRGLAVAALAGPYGSPRKVVVASVGEDGKTKWIEPDLPAGATFAELHAANEKLILIAAIADEQGLHWRKLVLEGGSAP